MVQKERGIFGENKNLVSARDLLNKYLAHWYVFALCLAICLGAGLYYIYHTPPKYIGTSSILVKGDEGRSDAASDLLESTLKVTRPVNLSNEMMLLKATSLMQRVVVKNDFNISYFIQGRILRSEVHNGSPFRLRVKNITDSSGIELSVVEYNVNGGKVEFTVGKQVKSFTFKWGQPVQILGKELVFEPRSKISTGGGTYIVTWNPPDEVAGELLQNMTVTPYDETTSVLDLSIKTSNQQKGIDILNELFKEFYQNDIDDRTKLAASTVQFINDRLEVVATELKGVEGDIEKFQGKNQLADIKGQLSQSLESSSSVTQTIKDLGIQQGVVNMILDYFQKPANGSKLVPSSIGLNDATLASLIAQYNELQLKREREAPLVAPNSTVMQDLNTQLGNLRGSILESLNSINKNLRLQESSFQQQSSQFRSFLSAVPHNERVMQEIKRQQSITEGLYLYLLQKREEAAISSTSASVAHYKQIDPASGYGPVEPNKRNIILYSVLLALAVAFGIVHLRDLMNDKIKAKEDITSQVSVPVIGQINHVSSGKKKTIEVLDRSLVSEQFRSLRTNLSLLLRKEDSKTIMVTSSVSGDGKSFISLNLGAVCAIPGRKTALLEFDIRNPVINDNLYIDNTKGITDYLNRKIIEPSEIARVVDGIPNLHIYPCGTIPDNPADLLLSERVNDLFRWLRNSYEYIIIDAAPAGLVTDPVILGKHADMVLYVVRQQTTKKKDISFIEESVTNNTLNNMYIVLNDVKENDKAKYKKYYGQSS